MSSKSKERSVKRISCILAFLQAVFLSTGAGMILFYFAFLSPDTIKNNLTASNYYMGLATQIIEGAEDILLPTGFPASVLEGAIDRSTVHIDIRAHIDGEFSGERHVLDHTERTAQLRANMEAYLMEIGHEISPELIDQIIHVLTAHYGNHIQFPFLSQLARLTSLYETGMLVVGAGCAILVLLILLFIKQINRWQHRTFRYWSYGFGASGMMLAGIPLAVKYNGFYRRLAIRPQFVYNFVMLHIDRGLLLFIIAGGAILLISAVFAVASMTGVSRLRKNRSKDAIIHAPQRATV